MCSECSGVNSLPRKDLKTDLKTSLSKASIWTGWHRLFYQENWMYIAFAWFLKPEYINFQPNPYVSVVAMGTFVFLQYLKGEGNIRTHSPSHISSWFRHEAKDKTLPHSPASTHARKKKWVHILLKQPHHNYRQSRCELLGAQTVWRAASCLYHGFVCVVWKCWSQKVTNPKTSRRSIADKLGNGFLLSLNIS